MKVQALRQHKSAHGLHVAGDVYVENDRDAQAKIARGLVKEVAPAKAPENKATKAPEKKKRAD